MTISPSSVPARSWKMDDATKKWLCTGHLPEEQASLLHAEAQPKSSYFISVLSGCYEVECGLIKGSGKA